MFTIMLAALDSEERSTAEQIYIQYKRQIYSIAYSILNNQQDAEDILNEVMVDVIENIEKFVTSDGNKIAAQIVIYTRNTAINRYRKNRRKSEVESSVTYMDEDGSLCDIDIADDTSIENIIMSRETSEMVRKRLLELPQDYRDAISLVYGLGYSYKEAANVLRITTNAVALRLYKAKKKLAKLAGGELYEHIQQS